MVSKCVVVSEIAIRDLGANGRYYGHWTFILRLFSLIGNAMEATGPCDGIGISRKREQKRCGSLIQAVSCLLSAERV